jgi:type I restriction enzyme S subunit
VIDTAYFVRLKRTDLEWEFVFDLLCRSNLQGRTSQTAIPGLNRDDAYGIHVIVPSKSLRTAYLEKREAIKVTIGQLDRGRERSQSLHKALRESLLDGGAHVQ